MYFRWYLWLCFNFSPLQIKKLNFFEKSFHSLVKTVLISVEWTRPEGCMFWPIKTPAAIRALGELGRSALYIRPQVYAFLLGTHTWIFKQFLANKIYDHANVRPWLIFGKNTVLLRWEWLQQLCNYSNNK